VAADASQDAIEAAVLADENVARHVGDHPVRKMIIVPGKLVNVVI
jgi:leucyl-tRNA synthetase